MPQRRRFLLVTTALSSATLLAAACGKDTLPGNPKGSTYDAGPALPANPKGSQYDDGQNKPIPSAEEAGAGGGTANPSPPDAAPPKQSDAGPIIRMPANPKGSHYDAGKKKPDPKP